MIVPSRREGQVETNVEATTPMRPKGPAADNGLARPTAGPAADGQAQSSGMALPPLAVSALMVTKADLIRALRVYVPHLADLEPIDGERFLLTVGPGEDERRGEA